jgi:hypothetical protein
MSQRDDQQFARMIACERKQNLKIAFQIGDRSAKGTSETDLSLHSGYQTREIDRFGDLGLMSSLHSGVRKDSTWTINDAVDLCLLNLVEKVEIKIPYQLEFQAFALYLWRGLCRQIETILTPRSTGYYHVHRPLKMHAWIFHDPLRNVTSFSSAFENRTFVIFPML